MQDDEEFSRKYTREELEDALNLDMYRILSDQIDHSALKARIDYLLAVESQLAAVTAQRDELLQTVKAVQTMCHGAIRVRIDGIIAKCEVQNG